jgi:taurine dioxygenase
MAALRDISIIPLAAALAAEVRGLDLSAPLRDETVEVLRHAWRDHQVLLFRGQRLSHAQHVAFSRRFGELDDHASIPAFRDKDFPEILRVANDVVGGRKQPVGRQWHSDLSITLNPARGSLLRCEVTPPVGGDTMFANTAAAYESLSAPIQRLLDGLEAVHDIATARQNRGRTDLAEARRRAPPVVHPMVRIHPETGRKALYVNEMSVRQIVGLTEEESRAILELVFAHVTRAENTYRHRWSPGDLLMWDNDATQHIALADYDINVPRVLYRTTILGEGRGRLAAEEECG